MDHSRMFVRPRTCDQSLLSMRFRMWSRLEGWPSRPTARLSTRSARTPSYTTFQPQPTHRLRTRYGKARQWKQGRERAVVCTVCGSWYMVKRHGTWHESKGARTCNPLAEACWMPAARLLTLRTQSTSINDPSPSALLIYHGS